MKEFFDPNGSRLFFLPRYYVLVSLGTSYDSNLKIKKSPILCIANF